MMLSSLEDHTKLVLAIMLFICLLDMPYSYYQFVRFIALIGFSILSFRANKEGRTSEMIVYLGLAILFQPLVTISLGRELWNIVDVIVGCALIASIFYEKKLKKSERI